MGPVLPTGPTPLPGNNLKILAYGPIRLLLRTYAKQGMGGGVVSRCLYVDVTAIQASSPHTNASTGSVPSLYHVD